MNKKSVTEHERLIKRLTRLDEEKRALPLLNVGMVLIFLTVCATPLLMHRPTDGPLPWAYGALGALFAFAARFGPRDSRQRREKIVRRLAILSGDIRPDVPGKTGNARAAEWPDRDFTTREELMIALVLLAIAALMTFGGKVPLIHALDDPRSDRTVCFFAFAVVGMMWLGTLAFWIAALRRHQQQKRRHDDP